MAVPLWKRQEIARNLRDRAPLVSGLVLKEHPKHPDGEPCSSEESDGLYGCNCGVDGHNDQVFRLLQDIRTAADLLDQE